MVVLKYFCFFMLFVDGENEVGKVIFVMLFKLMCKIDSYCGGGMMGVVSIDFGLDDFVFDVSFVMGGVVCVLFFKYGGMIDGMLLCFVGEYYIDVESDLYEIEMCGCVMEIDMGEVK